MASFRRIPHRIALSSVLWYSVLPSWLVLAAILLTGLTILGAQSVFAQEKSLVWERFDVDIIVHDDGSFDVAEHQRLRFTRGTFTFGFREIPKRNFNSQQLVGRG